MGGYAGRTAKRKVNTAIKPVPNPIVEVVSVTVVFAITAESLASYMMVTGIAAQLDR